MILYRDNSNPIYNKTAEKHKLDIVSTSGDSDYVKDGVVHQHQEIRSVMVQSQNDLTDIASLYPPCTIAYTAGFTTMWQLNTDGEFVEVV